MRMTRSRRLGGPGPPSLLFPLSPLSTHTWRTQLKGVEAAADRAEAEAARGGELRHELSEALQSARLREEEAMEQKKRQFHANKKTSVTQQP